jgi:hypothetical protein
MHHPDPNVHPVRTGQTLHANPIKSILFLERSTAPSLQDFQFDMSLEAVQHNWWTFELFERSLEKVIAFELFERSLEKVIASVPKTTLVDSYSRVAT